MKKETLTLLVKGNGEENEDRKGYCNMRLYERSLLFIVLQQID